jgi:hypothetical protein
MSLFDRVAGFGRAVMVYSDQTPLGRAGRGFVQPISAADTESMQRRTMPGVAGRSRYLLIAPLELLSREETHVVVRADGVEYELLRLERMGDGMPSHWEGILRLKGWVSTDA